MQVGLVGPSLTKLVNVPQRAASIACQRISMCVQHVLVTFVLHLVPGANWLHHCSAAEAALNI